MSIVKTIRARKSVRSYTTQSLSAEHREEVNRYISTLKTPFGESARIELLSGNDPQADPVKLGTYGVISGASDFLALIYKEGPMAEIAAGYMFEQVVLYCTDLGLGTCWLGATFKSGDFEDKVNLAHGERLKIVSPVGYSREKKTFMESVMRKGAGSDKRKPFGYLFFDGDFSTPLTEAAAGVYRTPLEMVRLAPSASNKQPWRVIVQADRLHFYYRDPTSRFSANDMGIAFCHFRETCGELNIAGSFRILGADEVPASYENKYAATWVVE